MHENEKVPEPLHPGTVAMTVNRAMIYLALLTVMAVVCFASFYPQPLFMATVSSLLTICAVASATIAFLRMQKPGAEHFTLWDVAAILMFIALGAGMFTDPAAIEAYLQSIAVPEAAAPAAEATQPAAPAGIVE